MENASKALLMAAGVLIGLLVISLAVYLFVSFGMTSAEIHKEQQEQQLEQFNVQFTSYVGKEGLTIYDVVTVANLATENNKNYELTKKVADGTDYYISVQVANQGFIEKGYNETGGIDYDQLIKNDIATMPGNALRQYTCSVDISPTTQRVYRVIFKRKT